MGMMSVSNEAWKDTGNCQEGRRRRYCKTKCAAYQRALRMRVERYFIRSTATGRLYPRPEHLIGVKDDGESFDVQPKRLP